MTVPAFDVYESLRRSDVNRMGC